MKYTKWLTIGAPIIAGVLLLGGIASAQTIPVPQYGHGFGMGGYGQGMRTPGVAGTVSAISGTTLTVTSKSFGRGQNTQNATTTTYTVDASNATVMKNGTSSSIGAVSVGDMIFVQGTVSGDSVTATSIRDGIPMGGPGGMHGPRNASGTWNGSSTKFLPSAIIQGNGQPVVGGSVTAIDGDTLTVTTAANSVVYTVDATNATIEKGNATSTVGSIAVGDDILVQGSVSGTSVTANSVIDQGAPHTASSSNGNGGGQGFAHGFVNAIGGFFHHLFGFF